MPVKLKLKEINHVVGGHLRISHGKKLQTRCNLGRRQLAPRHPRPRNGHQRINVPKPRS